jgi:hypothetical protein
MSEEKFSSSIYLSIPVGRPFGRWMRCENLIVVTGCLKHKIELNGGMKKRPLSSRGQITVAHEDDIFIDPNTPKSEG